MNRIGFIGAGNMGFNIMKGLLRDNPNKDIIFTDISEARMQHVKDQINIPYTNDCIQLVSRAKYIILAVKNEGYMGIAEEIRPYLTKDHIIISITPGYTIEVMKEWLGDDIRVVRTMPNTPSLVGEGMTAMAFSKDDYSETELETVKGIFISLGEVEVLEEKYMDAVVPIAGSSPAYVYMMIEAMADAGVLTGLPRKLCYKLAAQAVLGSAKMVLETQAQPGQLKDEVCSPGGTTIEAVAILENNNFRGTIIEAMRACFEKTKYLEI